MAAIDYEKYNKMSQKQLLNSLIIAEKKEQKLKANAEEKLKEISELVKFLKAKMKESLNKPRDDSSPYAENKSRKTRTTKTTKQQKDSLEKK